MKGLTNTQMDIIAEKICKDVIKSKKSFSDNVINSSSYKSEEQHIRTHDEIALAFTEYFRLENEISRLNELMENEKKKIKKKVDVPHFYNHLMKTEFENYIEKETMARFNLKFINEREIIKNIKEEILLSGISELDKLVKAITEKMVKDV